MFAAKRNRIDLDDAFARLDLIAQLPISVDLKTAEVTWTQTIKLARDYQLTTYDASYLEFAQRYKFSLATFDKALIRAAKDAQVDLYF